LQCCCNRNSDSLCSHRICKPCGSVEDSQLNLASLLMRHVSCINSTAENDKAFAAVQAQGLSSFLLPMLEYAPDKRATAADMLRHPWLQGCLPKIAALDLNREAASDKPHRRKSSHSRSASAYAAKRSR
jgi:serine/threonine protein kinase